MKLDLESLRDHVYEDGSECAQCPLYRAVGDDGECLAPDGSHCPAVQTAVAAAAVAVEKIWRMG